MNTLTQALATLAQQALLFLPRVIVALVIFFAGLYLAGLSRMAVVHLLRARNIDKQLTILLGRITRIAVLIFSTIVALQQVDFDLTAFLTGLGIVSLTIGFALQDVSKNLMAGVLLLLNQPFEIGDTVEVGDYSGTVVDISIRATKLRTFDGLPVLIPNADVYASAIKLFSHVRYRRLDVSIGVAYNSDLDLVSQAAANALKSIPGVLNCQDRAPSIVFQAFGDSAINLTVYFWVDLEQIGYFDAQDRAIKVLKTAFEEAQIEIPYPTHSLLIQRNEA